MNYTITSDISGISRKRWSHFVTAHPHGNIFHTPEYYELCNSVPGYSGVAICAIKDDEISGILVAVIQREHRGISGILTARAVVFGGPLVTGDDPEITSALLKAFDEKIRGKVLFSQIRNLRDTSFLKPLFLSAGYEFEDHLDIHINLAEGTEKLWNSLHPTRRKQIGRSERRGVTVRESSPEDPAVLARCYDILKKTYKREGLPLPSLFYFKRASSLFAPVGMLKLFTAYSEGEIIGFRMVLCFGRSIYDWYAASDSTHNDKYPNDILPWEIIRYGSQNGWSLFDFGGAGKPGIPYGVRDYKQKFGGETINPGRYQKVLRPFLYMVVMFVFKLRKR